MATLNSPKLLQYTTGVPDLERFAEDTQQCRPQNQFVIFMLQTEYYYGTCYIMMPEYYVCTCLVVTFVYIVCSCHVC